MAHAFVHVSPLNQAREISNRNLHPPPQKRANNQVSQVKRNDFADSYSTRQHVEFSYLLIIVIYQFANLWFQGCDCETAEKY